jgi:hypothetical protein
MLCTSCRLIFSEPLKLGTWYCHGSGYSPAHYFTGPLPSLNDGRPNDYNLSDLENAAKGHCHICATRYNAHLRFKDAQEQQRFWTKGLKAQYHIRLGGQPSFTVDGRDGRSRPFLPSYDDEVENKLSINSAGAIIGTLGHHESEIKKSVSQPRVDLILEFRDLLGEDDTVSFGIAMIGKNLFIKSALWAIIL